MDPADTFFKEPCRAPRLLTFITSMTGRMTRILVGVVMILVGGAIGGVPGWLLALVGLEPIMAGAFDFCLAGPLFGTGTRGSHIRHDLAERPMLVRERDHREGRIDDEDEARYPPFAA